MDIQWGTSASASVGHAASRQACRQLSAPQACLVDTTNPQPCGACTTLARPHTAQKLTVGRPVPAAWDVRAMQMRNSTADAGLMGLRTSVSGSDLCPCLLTCKLARLAAVCATISHLCGGVEQESRLFPEWGLGGEEALACRQSSVLDLWQAVIVWSRTRRAAICMHAPTELRWRVKHSRLCA